MHSEPTHTCQSYLEYAPDAALQRTQPGACALHRVAGRLPHSPALLYRRSDGSSQLWHGGYGLWRGGKGRKEEQWEE